MVWGVAVLLPWSLFYKELDGGTPVAEIPPRLSM